MYCVYTFLKRLKPLIKQFFKHYIFMRKILMLMGLCTLLVYTSCKVKHEEKEEEVMFQIMPALYQAEMQKAQAEANFAEIEYRTTKSLADSNVVSQNELA